MFKRPRQNPHICQNTYIKVAQLTTLIALMNKLQLTEQLGAKLGTTHHEAERFLNTFIKLVYERLNAGDKVNISGFGQFSISHRESRIGVNPRNPSQKIVIAELNTPKFKAGEVFKNAIALKTN